MLAYEVNEMTPWGLIFLPRIYEAYKNVYGPRLHNPSSSVFGEMVWEETYLTRPRF
jgi:hypothetical protein